MEEEHDKMKDAIGTALLVILVSAPFLPLLNVRVRRALVTWIARFRLHRLEKQRQQNVDASSKDGPTVSGVYIYPVKSLQAVSMDSVKLDSFGFVNDRRFMLVAPSPPRISGSFHVVKKSHRFITQRQYPILATIRASLKEQELTLEANKGQKITINVSEKALADNPTFHAGIWDDVVEVVDVGDAAADFVHSVISDNQKDDDVSFITMGIRLVAMKEATVVSDAYVPPVARSWFGQTPETSLNDGFPLLIASEASLQELNGKLVAKGKQPIPMSRFRPNIVIQNTEPFEEDTWKAIRIGDTVLHVVKGCPRCKQSCTDQITGQVSDEPLATLADFRALGRTKENVYFAQNAVPQTSNKQQMISVGDSVTILTRGDPVWDKEQVKAE